MNTNLLLTAALSLSLCAASTAQTLPAYLPTDGLVGWWPFNGNANDESGNGNNGTVNGATLTADRFGNANNAYWFQNGNRITIAPNLPTGNSPRSFSVWFQTSSLNYDPSGLNANVIFNYGSVGVGNFFGLETLNGLLVTTYYGQSTLGSYFVSDGTWHHCAYSFDGDSAYFYIDGDLMEVEPTVLNTITTNLVLGTRFSEPNWHNYNGKIDELAFYNRALSPEEITALYTGEPVNPPTVCNPLPFNLQNGLVGYWPFCGNANDESGNGNDGTVNGATLTEDRFGVANAAYAFDGVDDYITLPPSANVNTNSNSYSVSVWLNPMDLTPQDNGREVIADRAVNEWNFRYRLNYSISNSEYLSNTTYFGSCGDICYDTYSANPILNEWQNYLITYDGLNLLLKTYKNGEIIGVLNNVPFQEGLRQINVGRTISPAFPQGVAPFDGAIDDIGIWNRALSPEEVQQLYTLNACTFTVYDTVTVENVVTVYDTVLTTVTDTLIINTLITELAPPANTNTIKVFPNPAGSILTIDYGNFALMTGYQLRIENSLGQEVFQSNISQQSDTLSLGSWGGNGLYFVHIVDPQGNTIDIRKIVLQ